MIYRKSQYRTQLNNEGAVYENIEQKTKTKAMHFKVYIVAGGEVMCTVFAIIYLNIWTLAIIYAFMCHYIASNDLLHTPQPHRRSSLCTC
jgi:hypothetical protein